MKRSTLSRTGTAVVASVFSLALATGCSDSGSGDGDKAGGSGKPTAAAKALTDTELTERILATGDVDGYKVEPANEAGAFAKSKDDVTVVAEKCAPLAYVLTGFAPGDEAAYVNRMVSKEVGASPSASSDKGLEDMTDAELEEAMKDLTDVLGQTMTIVSLSSYEGDGAQKTMASVSDAIKGCGSGFKATANGEPQKFTKVAEEKASGTGDESLAFAVTGDAEGQEVVVHAEVVRHGSTIATYYAFSLAAFSGEGGAGDYDVPAEIIKGQAAKLA
ncbi:MULTISPECIES: hypothetical protein [Streptomyces]|uniref:Lipoprotein n=1 Tax=Streptomyces dengpaensis TaxID=2049881 RepID=A0ABN5I0R6_9ACTN|nr:MULTISPECIES: hypothetical protein [Streptomyces]AVH57003.1 hypothetical protein C4B68_15835 [Streptomyces dengpaensis]PIB09094.1 hypothetical protein B1C81_12685 [Streptomyces sp. HG99]